MARRPPAVARLHLDHTLWASEVEECETHSDEPVRGEKEEEGMEEENSGREKGREPRKRGEEEGGRRRGEDKR